MLDMRFRGVPYMLMGAAVPPTAANAGSAAIAEGGYGVPDFPVAGLLWTPPPATWAPIRPLASRHHLTVVK